MRTVIHVTESFASGTASAIRDYVRNYPRAEHHLVFATRPEAPVDDADLIGFSRISTLPAGTPARILFLRRLLAHRRGAIVHAHSSRAGGYVRLAVTRSDAHPIVYTPHCYASERRDVASVTRRAFRAVEWALSFNTTAVAACSPREADLSRWHPRAPQIVYVPNVAPADVPAHTGGPGQILHVVGNGRLSAQKDARFFAATVRAARAEGVPLVARWIGDGDPEQVATLHAAGVEVTGWVPRPIAQAQLAAEDVYLHTARWEGFPISVLEAAAAGLPVIARRQPYLRGVGLPLIADSADDGACLLAALAEPGYHHRMVEQTRTSLGDHTDNAQHDALDRLYAPLFGDG
ncbi:glycosyltransferase family 4 protein [Gordonia sp. NPDC003376]